MGDGDRGTAYNGPKLRAPVGRGVLQSPALVPVEPEKEMAAEAQRTKGNKSFFPLRSLRLCGYLLLLPPLEQRERGRLT